MFTVDSNITDLRIKERVVAKVIFSMNSPQVATPELSTEEARCYIVVFHEGNTYRMHIGLYLPNSDRRFYYTYSENPFAEARLAEALDDAARFAEEMGFLLDELKLSTMSVDERNQWIDSQQIFGGPKSAEQPEPEEEPGEEQRPEDAAAEKEHEPVPEKPKEIFPESPSAQAAEQPAPPVQEPATEQKIAEPAAPSPPTALPAAPAPAAAQQTPPAEPGTAGTQQEPAAPPEPAPREPARMAAPETPVPVEQTPAPAPRSTVAHPKVAPTPPPVVEQEEADEEEAAPAAQKTVPAKQQKPRMKKAARATTGTVSREHEALARLLASF